MLAFWLELPEVRRWAPAGQLRPVAAKDSGEVKAKGPADSKI